MIKILRMTDKKKRVLAYAAYAFAVAAIFAFLLFPDRAVRDLVEKSAGHIHPDMTVRLADVDLSLLPGVNLQNLSIFFGDQHYGDVRYLRVSPSFLTLLGARRVFLFKGRILEGGLKGVCRQDRKTGKWTFDMTFSKVGLEDMEFLKRLSPQKLAGTADGRIEGEFDGRQATIRSDLVLSNVEMALKTPVLSIETLGFERIEATVAKNGERVRIERCIGKGKQLDGELSGDILVRRPYGQSSLRLRGFFKPQSALVATLGKSLPVDMMLGKNAGDKGFPIQLTGTLADPGFFLR